MAFLDRFFTVREYLESKTDLRSRIEAIEALINEMLLTSMESVGNDGTFSYSMDDGQMKVTTQYRSVEQVMRGVQHLEKIKNIYINRHNGHTTVLRGRKNFRGHHGFGRY